MEWRALGHYLIGFHVGRRNSPNLATVIITSAATIVSNFGKILCHGNRLSIEDNNNLVPSKHMYLLTKISNTQLVLVYHESIVS